MNIKLVLCRAAVASLVCLAMPRAVFSEEDAEGPKPYDLVLSDTEKVDVIDAIKAYVYAKPPTKDSLKVFDAVKGDVVILTFQRILVDKSAGGCAAKGAGGHVAVCAEFSAPDGDTYVLIFVVKQETAREEVWSGGTLTKQKPLGQMIVRDVIIGSVNGVQRQEWEQDAKGFWHSKPDNVVEGELPAESEPAAAPEPAPEAEPGPTSGSSSSTDSATTNESATAVKRAIAAKLASEAERPGVTDPARAVRPAPAGTLRTK